ncbi:MAG: DUF3578 domain-containing protein, partial [Gammaproteobacteria bacterium]|nr:DUF3578 domain-containing protein [Gammaproteobacteria bacterium]
MSRYCADMPTEAILNAADYWRNECLLSDGSIFTNGQFWKLNHFLDLEKYFIDQPDPGEGDFLEKLEKQLSPTDSVAKMLAAEMFWVMYLCTSSLYPKHKIHQIKTVWSWSSNQFPDESEWLSDEVLAGIG